MGLFFAFYPSRVRHGSITFLQITTKLQLIHILQITISITSNYCEFTNYNFTNTITFSHVCCLQIPVGLHLNIMLDIGYDIIELWYLIMVFAVCKSKRKDTSITALMHAGTGTIIHYHYWLSVTINCHYYSFHVSENNRQCMRFICLLYLMNTSNVVRTSPPWVWSGIDSIVFLPFDPHAEYQKRVTSLPPCQWVIVILEHCGSEIIRKFLAHGQRRISMIWLAALGRTIHKAEQLRLLWRGFLGLWWLTGWCEVIVNNFCPKRSVIVTCKYQLQMSNYNYNFCNTCTFDLTKPCRS